MSITSNQNKTCAVIPFYNEERTIAEVINRALNFVNAVIAVNDGSTDNSKKNVPKNERIICLENIVNEGKGVALNKGFAESTKRGFEFTITLDSDLQHIPDKIPDFILALNNYDIVIGNRLNDLSDMPLHRILSNKISSGLLSLKTGQKILDSQSGFRGFRTKILNDILPSFSGYEAESEILINAARKNYKIGFVPIPAIYADEKSKIKPVQIIFSFFKTLFI
ncbi:MAG: glycosyltransferase family 2 protein [Ignavibacteriaceae bacterium]